MPLSKAAEITPDLGTKQLFCPLVKVDEVKQEVWTVVTAELPDRDAEVCNYETTVPYYKELVAEMKKASDGKNIFPLREMHGLFAAGKGISIEFRDDKKEIYMGFKVVDPLAWKKVSEGVYTGVSQGGRYIKKWKEGEYTYYTAKPSEVSLVDLPCLERAHFDYVKSDGTIEIRKFQKSPEIPTGNIGALPDKIQQPLDVDSSPAECKCSCEACTSRNCATCTADPKCGKTFKVLGLTEKMLAGGARFYLGQQL